MSLRPVDSGTGDCGSICIGHAAADLSVVLKQWQRTMLVLVLVVIVSARPIRHAGRCLFWCVGGCLFLCVASQHVDTSHHLNRL
jgi:hypothetical protein